MFEKKRAARFRARAPLDPAKRIHRVYFSNVIHNSSIFHRNNLKFWEKLLLTSMNNFPTGSFLYVKLLQIILSAKLEKHDLRRATICYWISIKNRPFKAFKGSCTGLNGIFYMSERRTSRTFGQWADEGMMRLKWRTR